METIKINIKNPVYGSKILDVIDIYEDNDTLLIRVENAIEADVHVGDNVYFKRSVYDENGDYSEVSTPTTVVAIEKMTENSLYYDIIRTTIPQIDGLEIDYRWTTHIKLVETEDEINHIGDAWLSTNSGFTSGVTKGQMLVKNPGGISYDDTLAKINYGGKEYYKLRFASNHNIYQQDIENIEDFDNEYDIAVKNFNGGIIGYLKGISIPMVYYDRKVTIEDSYTTTELETCGYYDSQGRPYNMYSHKYFHSPSWFSRDTILFTGVTTSVKQYYKDGQTIKVETEFDKLKYIIENGVTFHPKYNPYYFFSVTDKGKRCVLWGDYWWDKLSEKNNRYPQRDLFVNVGKDSSAVSIEDDYWKVPMITLSNDGYDLENVDIINQSYAEELYAKLIPDVIDMERFKYVPASGDTLITKINIYPHFLEREGSRWYVSPTSATTTWWNGYPKSVPNNDAKFNEAKFTEFINVNGKRADMLGYLNFTDDDVYYRKSRLSKSFLRLSFYSTNDPLDQKLLYTSTIFVDTTRLYGKYMKKYIEREENGSDTPLVLYKEGPEDTLLNSKFTIENEFNTETSSEGFNLYLFADDAGINNDRTIYMRVDFNHAGVGKTIPLILWPKEGNHYKPITLDGSNGSVKFLDALYIPVNLKYINERYIYEIERGKLNGTELDLVLFEPKVDATDVKE